MSDSARIFLGVGSNIDPAHNIPAGLDALRALFGAIECSNVYQSDAVGFAGAPFWNLVITCHSDLSAGVLQRALRQIEYDFGRPKNASRFSDRHLDIDILLVGNLTGVVDGVELPRGEILEQAFVLRPLAELAPKLKHPLVACTLDALWRDFDQESQRLLPVDLGQLLAVI
ncbi:MAG: 2-amino-4-hydroxy-6-hydroxymethyldihydropteridine diphosphokinase [Pseudomonadota bacterium]